VSFLLLAIVGGALLELGLDLMIATLALRILNIQSLLFVLDTFFSDFGNYPLKIFGGTVQFLLTFGLPLAFMAYFPSAVLLGKTGELNVPPIIALLGPGKSPFPLQEGASDLPVRSYLSRRASPSAACAAARRAIGTR
jgi:ABC-2 type transport system permease protein